MKEYNMAHGSDQCKKWYIFSNILFDGKNDHFLHLLFEKFLFKYIKFLF